MESLNSNSQERELHPLQQMQDRAKESCMMFLYSRFSFDNDESIMIRKYFISYTKTDVPLFHDKLIHNMESIQESIQKREKHKREYDRRMNDRMMQLKEGNVDSSKAFDAGLVVIESNETESERHVSSSRSGKDTHAEDVDINSVNDKQPMAEVDINTTPDSTDMSHRGGEIDQNAVKCQVSALNDGQHGQILNETSNKAKIKKEIEVLETINIELEQSVAKLLAKNEKLHKENEHLKQTYKDLYDSIKKIRVQTKDLNDSLITQVNRKPVLQPPINQSIVRQPNALKSERPNFLKPRFASQVDVNNNLPKPVTPHYLPKVRESVLAKPYHVIARGSSRSSSKESYRSNDMAYNYYLEESKKKTQDKNRNLKPKEIPSARTHHSPNTCTPKSRSNNQMSRHWPASKSSEETLKAAQKAYHSSNPSSFSDSKHFVCSTCQKCVFNANHDACITKFMKDVNSRVKIIIGHRFSPNKSSAVHEKTNTPRSCLRWIPTGRIFNTVGLRWVPTRKIFTSSTTKVDRELPNGLNENITNPYKCDQTLNVRVAPEVIAPIVEVVALEPAKSTGPPSSTTVDQVAPSSSNLQTSLETQSPVIPNDVEEENHDLDVAHMNNNLFFGIPILENDSEASSSSDVIPTIVQTAAPNSEHVNKWTKDHPLENTIGELGRPVSIRLQLY
ncbi:hypothetical protein Tco_0898174 [Tanacetum coccineum]